MNRTSLSAPLAMLGTGFALVSVFCPLFHFSGGLNPPYDLTLLRQFPGWRELVPGLGAFSLVMLGFGRTRPLIGSGVLLAVATLYLFVDIVGDIAAYNERGREFADDWNRQFGHGYGLGPIAPAVAAWSYGWLVLVAGAAAFIASGAMRPRSVSKYAPTPSRRRRALVTVLAALLLVVVPSSWGFGWDAHKRRLNEARVRRAKEDCRYFHERAMAWKAENGRYPRSIRQMTDAGFAEPRRDPWGGGYQIHRSGGVLRVSCYRPARGRDGDEFVYPPLGSD